jgi:hypothetical protein
MKNHNSLSTQFPHLGLLFLLAVMLLALGGVVGWWMHAEFLPESVVFKSTAEVSMSKERGPVVPPVEEGGTTSVQNKHIFA